MCSQLATVMTLLATLLHSALGCCWHHVHACECGSSGQLVQAAAVSPTHSSRCCSHSTDSQHRDSQSPEVDRNAPACPAEPAHQHDSCSEAHCVYVNSRVQQLAMSLELPPLVVVNPPTCLATPGRVEFCSRLPAAARQLRALMQVWLI